jgi:hypothetical protein
MARRFPSYRIYGSSRASDGSSVIVDFLLLDQRDAVGREPVGGERLTFQQQRVLMGCTPSSSSDQRGLTARRGRESGRSSQSMAAKGPRQKKTCREAGQPQRKEGLESAGGGGPADAAGSVCEGEAGAILAFDH